MLIFILISITYASVICNNNQCHCNNDCATLEQYRNPQSNGCGQQGSWIHYTPPRNWHLTEVCNAHDICYGTCGNSKDNCDLNLCNDLQIKCSFITEVPERGDCMRIAGLMCKAVKTFGTSAFKNAQNEYCKCNTTNCQNIRRDCNGAFCRQHCSSKPTSCAVCCPPGRAAYCTCTKIDGYAKCECR